MLAEPPSGCSKLTNYEEIEGNIVLMIQVQDDCSAVKRAELASNANAIGMLVLSSGFSRGSFGKW